MIMAIREQELLLEGFEQGYREAFTKSFLESRKNMLEKMNAQYHNKQLMQYLNDYSQDFEKCLEQSLSKAIDRYYFSIREQLNKEYNERLYELVMKLFELNRVQDAVRVTKDSRYRNQLLQELDI